MDNKSFMKRLLIRLSLLIVLIGIGYFVLCGVSFLNGNSLFLCHKEYLLTPLFFGAVITLLDNYSFHLKLKNINNKKEKGMNLKFR